MLRRPFEGRHLVLVILRPLQGLFDLEEETDVFVKHRVTTKPGECRYCSLSRIMFNCSKWGIEIAIPNLSFGMEIF